MVVEVGSFCHELYTTHLRKLLVEVSQTVTPYNALEELGRRYAWRAASGEELACALVSITAQCRSTISTHPGPSRTGIHHHDPRSRMDRRRVQRSRSGTCRRTLG